MYSTSHYYNIPYNIPLMLAHAHVPEIEVIMWMKLEAEAYLTNGGYLNTDF
jgi:hypothetical protein